MVNLKTLAKMVVACSVCGGAAVGLGRCLTANVHGAPRRASGPGPMPRVASADGSVVCTGRVEPVRGEVDVAAQIAGRLAEVRVVEGDTLREGDVLAVLDAS